jgi:hypothetical protein
MGGEQVRTEHGTFREPSNSAGKITGGPKKREFRFSLWPRRNKIGTDVAVTAVRCCGPPDYERS